MQDVAMWGFVNWLTLLLLAALGVGIIAGIRMACQAWAAHPERSTAHKLAAWPVYFLFCGTWWLIGVIAAFVAALILDVLILLPGAYASGRGVSDGLVFLAYIGGAMIVALAVWMWMQRGRSRSYAVALLCGVPAVLAVGLFWFDGDGGRDPLPSAFDNPGRAPTATGQVIPSPTPNPFSTAYPTVTMAVVPTYMTSNMSSCIGGEEWVDATNDRTYRAGVLLDQLDQALADDGDFDGLDLDAMGKEAGQLVRGQLGSNPPEELVALNQQRVERLRAIRRIVEEARDGSRAEFSRAIVSYNTLIEEDLVSVQEACDF